jgi:nitrite reductase (NADH) small subunit
MSEWKKICRLADIPPRGSRVVSGPGHDDIAIFRSSDDQLFAVHDKCPHKGGPLSQGIVHGHQVTCPLHSWKIELASGNAVAPDVGCTQPFAVRLEDGVVWLAI